MKKGSRIQIENTAKYEGQNMKWTETFTGMKKIETGNFFHVSSTKLNSFFPKNTCFADKLYSEGFYYQMKIINPVIVETYSSDEIRINLEKYKNDIEIYYIGTITGKNTGNVHPKGATYGMERIRKDNTKII